MAVSLDARVKAAPDVMVTEAGGESVLLDLKSEKYFGLDDVGTRMWQAVTTSATVRDAHQQLLATYAVAPDVLERDLLAWLEEMASHGLVEVVDG